MWFSAQGRGEARVPYEGGSHSPPHSWGPCCDSSLVGCRAAPGLRAHFYRPMEQSAPAQVCAILAGSSGIPRGTPSSASGPTQGAGGLPGCPGQMSREPLRRGKKLRSISHSANLGIRRKQRQSPCPLEAPVLGKETNNQSRLQLGVLKARGAADTQSSPGGFPGNRDFPPCPPPTPRHRRVGTLEGLRPRTP